MQIRPTQSLTVKADLQRMYADAAKYELEYSTRDMSRLETIRASQLPFCPLEFVLSTAKNGPHQAMGFHMAYFTSVGTIVHEVMQRYHGKSGKFLANWQCPTCKKWRNLSLQPNCCDTLSDYHEVQIRHKWVTGHIDGIFLDSQGQYWITDYKTTSSTLALSKEKNPGRVYIEQVEAYAFAMQEQYNVPIKGVSLVFICRDNPTTPHIWAKELHESDYKQIGKRLEHYYHMHKLAYDAKSKTDLQQIWKQRMCKTGQEDATAPNCPFKRGCSHNDPTEAITWFRKGIKSKYIPVRQLVESSK